MKSQSIYIVLHMSCTRVVGSPIFLVLLEPLLSFAPLGSLQIYHRTAPLPWEAGTAFGQIWESQVHFSVTEWEKGEERA
jgi:hypothetical protein